MKVSLWINLDAVPEYSLWINLDAVPEYKLSWLLPHGKIENWSQLENLVFHYSSSVMRVKLSLALPVLQRIVLKFQIC